MSSDTAFGFADEMRVGLRGMVRRVWGRRGVKVVQRVQVVYRWTYLFLALDVQRGRLVWRWIDSMRSDDIAGAVKELKHHSDMKALVWDGARGHRGEAVRNVGLSTIIQPAYSPELNPVERVFEEVRRWVEGKVYGSIEKVRNLNSIRITGALRHYPTFHPTSSKPTAKGGVERESPSGIRRSKRRAKWVSVPSMAGCLRCGD